MPSQTAPDATSDTAPDLDYAAPPALLVIADGPAATARARSAAIAADLRIAFNVGVGEALGHLIDGPAAGCVLLELGDDPNEATVAAILSHLNEAARTGRYASVVSTPAQLIDLVAANAWHPNVQQLADATTADRAAALGIAARPAVALVGETNLAGDAARLRVLTDEVGRIAGALARLSGGVSPSTVAPDPATDDDHANRAEIRRIQRTRRLRTAYFDAVLFADPAWDMLLDLTAARLDGQRVAVSSLCIAAAVPPTTALRWIKTLTDCGLFLRAADPADGRRVFIELSDDAARGMRAYLAAVRTA